MKPHTVLPAGDLPGRRSRPGQQADSLATRRFRRCVVPNGTGEDFVFAGRLIGFVSSSLSPDGHAAEQTVAKWTELTLYVTPSGDYVCHEAVKSHLADEPAQDRVRIIEYLDRYPLWTDGNCPAPGTVRLGDQEVHKRVRQFFGNDALAKQLYVEADIAHD